MVRGSLEQRGKLALLRKALENVQQAVWKDKRVFVGK